MIEALLRDVRAYGASRIRHNPDTTLWLDSAYRLRYWYSGDAH